MCFVVAFLSRKNKIFYMKKEEEKRDIKSFDSMSFCPQLISYDELK